jgi:hypothetical protein
MFLNLENYQLENSTINPLFLINPEISNEIKKNKLSPMKAVGRKMLLKERRVGFRICHNLVLILDRRN